MNDNPTPSPPGERLVRRPRQRRREPLKTMDNTTNSKQSEARRSLHAVVSRHCAHIRKPYTLEEICERVAGNEYNAELMVQHLLLWGSANAEVSEGGTRDSRIETAAQSRPSLH